MRSVLLSAVLGVASLGFLGALPSSAEAGPWRYWRDSYYSSYYYPPTVTYSAPAYGTTVNYGPTWTSSYYTPSDGAVYYSTPATTYYYPTYYRTYYYPRRAYWSSYSPVYYYP